MIDAEKVEKAIEKYHFMCIFRVNEIDLEVTEQAVDVCIENGAKMIEITYNHFGMEEKTFQMVEDIKKKHPEVYCGYGTILNSKEAEAAYNHNADFIVSPIFDIGTMEYAKSVNMFYMPGVFTASEAVSAYNAGAKIVKLFPTGEFGTGYGVALMKPLGFIKYFAVGKMTPEFYEECLKCGFIGAGISSSINSTEILKNKDFATIAAKIRQYKDITDKLYKS